MILARHSPVEAFVSALQGVLDTNQAYTLLPAGTWLEGGCAILAAALQECIGGRLVTVGRQTLHGIVDHVVLQTVIADDTYFVDYDGVQSCRAMEQKVCREGQFTSVAWGLYDPIALERAGVPLCSQRSKTLATLLQAHDLPALLTGPFSTTEIAVRKKRSA